VIYSGLGLVRDAEEAARYHIRRYGRVGWRERRALQKLGIDADAMYVEHRGHVA